MSALAGFCFVAGLLWPIRDARGAALSVFLLIVWPLIAAARCRFALEIRGQTIAMTRGIGPFRRARVAQMDELEIFGRNKHGVVRLKFRGSCDVVDIGGGYSGRDALIRMLDDARSHR